MVRFLWWMTAGMLTAFIAGAGSAPSLSATTLPATPEPASCSVAPRSLAEVRELVGFRSSEQRSVELVVPRSLPTGLPADAATVGAITDAVYQLIACGNTGDPLRLLALYSDGALRQMGPLDNEWFSALTTPTAQPDERWVTLIAVWDVQVLPDGRVAALVLEGNRQDTHPAPGRTGMLLFVQDADQWLLDEFIETVATHEGLVAVADLVGTPVPET